MNLPEAFRKYIAKEKLFQPGERLLLAVSGGLDSSVICHLCHVCGYTFRIAHCNFQLRGEESDRDEEFVRQLARHYNVPLFVKKIDTKKLAADMRLSIQVAARELRYAWFREIILEDEKEIPVKNHPPVKQWIVTAHHANDNIETLLMNFFKGTGIAGLRGILPRQGLIIRPLLFARREDIMEYAAANNLGYVEDSSNLSAKYTRNFFRHNLIPQIQNIFPAVEDNLIDNLQRFRDIELIYNKWIKQYIGKLAVYKDEEVHIPVLKLKQAEPFETICYELIRQFGFSTKQVNEVQHLLDSETGKYIQSGSHRILKNRKWLIITPLQTVTPKLIVVEEGDRSVSFSGGQLLLTKKANPGTIPASALEACLDAASIRFPLLLRKWKPGDYFYPLGMRKKKKLSRFFIDTKMSMAEKENAWVIEMDKKIIWVIGRRIDDRFKVTSHTQTVLSIQYQL